LRLFFKILLFFFFVSGLFFIGWFVFHVLSILESVQRISPFLVVVGCTYYIRPSQRDRVHKGNCTCPACREKYFGKAERRKARQFAKALKDIPLFCRVFPEGIVGSCGFCFYGYCAVFESECVRWNELGDKRNYSSGLPNPFKGGDCC